MNTKFLGHSANDLFFFIIPLVLPSLLSRYELSYAQAGGILTLYLMVIAAGSFLIGRLSDRASKRRILSWGFGLAAAGIIASGFAPNLPVFLVLISITAVGASSFHPVMYAVLDELYKDRLSSILGIYESFGTAAILLMFFVNGFLLERIGVRGVLVATAVPAIAMALVYALGNSIPDKPASQRPKTEEGEGADRQRSDVIRMVMFMVTVMLRVLSVSALLNFLPTIFVHFFGMNESSAAYSTAFYFAGGIAGSLIVSRISGRFNSFAIILAGTVFICFTMFILAGSMPVWVYLIIITLYGGFASGCIINQNILTVRLGGAMGKGEAFGILMAASTITAALSPALFGYIIDLSGYRNALFIFSVPLIVSAAVVAGLLADDRRRARAAKPSAASL